MWRAGHWGLGFQSQEAQVDLSVVAKEGEAVISGAHRSTGQHTKVTRDQGEPASFVWPKQY